MTFEVTILVIDLSLNLVITSLVHFQKKIINHNYKSIKVLINIGSLFILVWEYYFIIIK